VRLAAIVLLAACGSSPPPRVELPPTKPAEVVVVNKYDPTAVIETRVEEVSFKGGAHEVPGTLIQPLAPGKYIGIVLMAGSGPTDRDWTSKLIPGTNGSGKLLAQLWASHGAVVVRFDKAAVGENRMPHEQVTVDTYVDEIRGALNLLRSRDAIDPDRLFLAGNSEGGMHVIRAAVAEGGAIHGVILLSSMGRTGRDIVISQNQAALDEVVRQQKMTAADAKSELDAVTQALDAFIEDRPLDPALLQREPKLAQFAHLPDAKLIRDLWSYDPAEGAAKLHVPVLVINGLKDVQVDPQADAARLEAKIRAAGGDVKMFLAPDANHVLKHETRSLATLRASMGEVLEGYNAPGTQLDSQATSAIDAWLVDHAAPPAKGSGS
jgi:dipeptidyl aminopeptidase/acylaminoacyl peptidase